MDWLFSVVYFIIIEVEVFSNDQQRHSQRSSAGQCQNWYHIDAEEEILDDRSEGNAKD